MVRGCFFIRIPKSKTNKTGSQVQVRFTLTQHARDEQLMQNLIDYFGCGKYFSYSNKDKGEFVVVKFSDIIEKIIPFFDEYQMVGVKSMDYADFKRVADLMQEKAHLTSSGVEQIQKIKSGMNRGRSSYQPL